MGYASWSVVFGEQPSAAKWNILGTNDSSFNDGTGIAAAAITPEKLVSGAGTTWPQQSFTPSPTGYTGAVTVNIASYCRIGNMIFISIDFTGTSNSTSCGFTLPVAAKRIIDMPIVVMDAGTIQNSPGKIETAAASTSATVYKSLDGSGFTASGVKRIFVSQGFYEANA